MKNVDRRIV